MDYGLAIATRSQCSTNLEVSSHCDVAPFTIESNYNAQRVPGPLQTMGVQLVMQSEYIGAESSSGRRAGAVPFERTGIWLRREYKGTFVAGRPSPALACHRNAMTRILLPLVAAFLFSDVSTAAPASAASSVAASAMSGAVVPVASGAVSSFASSPLATRTSAVASSAGAPPPPAATVPLASDDPNPILFLPDTDIIPTAQRGQLGASVIGPQNVPIDRQNADLLAPPTTDHGTV